MSDLGFFHCLNLPLEHRHTLWILTPTSGGCTQMNSSQGHLRVLGGEDTNRCGLPGTLSRWKQMSP